MFLTMVFHPVVYIQWRICFDWKSRFTKHSLLKWAKKEDTVLFYLFFFYFVVKNFFMQRIFINWRRSHEILLPSFLAAKPNWIRREVDHSEIDRRRREIESERYRKTKGMYLRKRRLIFLLGNGRGIVCIQKEGDRSSKSKGKMFERSIRR